MRVLERGWVSSNNILLFDGDDSATLIDTGYVTHSEQTLLLVRHALNGRQLTRIINTHLHSDHCGGNALLKKTLGPAVLIPPGHADAVERWDDAALGYSACGQACDRFMHDALIQPGERLMLAGDEWQAFASRVMIRIRSCCGISRSHPHFRRCAVAARLRRDIF